MSWWKDFYLWKCIARYKSIMIFWVFIITHVIKCVVHFKSWDSREMFVFFLISIAWTIMTNRLKFGPLHDCQVTSYRWTIQPKIKFTRIFQFIEIDVMCNKKEIKIFLIYKIICYSITVLEQCSLSIYLHLRCGKKKKSVF